ncbi:MAG: hypothetical protein K2X48_20025 [Chitinophagaceae bacterium]|nr:hypothetical protein [Chitinophagaceae bacterium]
MLTLFPDEQIVPQSSEGAVTLTTHRICYEYKEWGRSYNQNIMLEHITSCENYYHTQVWLLIVGGLCLVGGLIAGANSNTEALSIGTLVALICGLLFWITRRNFVIIASPSTKMQIKVTGMQRERILNFINKVEQTKHQRILTINNRNNITG